MVGSGTTKAKDLTNTDLAMDSFPQNTFNIAGGADVKKFGVVVGTNTAAVSVSDYSITVPSGLTLNATAVGASSVGADSISVEISRQIGNSTGSTVNLKEAGLICGSEDEVNSNVLIARDLLDITLENGKKSVWRYTINFNFANDVGGFVKTFADKMFDKIFSLKTSSAGWGSRTRYLILSFKNKLWMMGGYDGSSFRNDVWSSSDGITWTLVKSSAAWSGRNSFSGCVFKDEMWIMGGNNGPALRDVWHSSNGIDWNYTTLSAPWPERRFPSVLVFDDKMWIMGGNNSSNVLNDVWSSSDGITWTQVTSHAAWTERDVAGVAVFDNKMWIMGGATRDTATFNDVWYSENGSIWLQATSSAAWSIRKLLNCCYAYKNKLCFSYGTETWYSEDGSIWIKANQSNYYTNVNALVFNNQIWKFSDQQVVASKTLSLTNFIPGSSDSTFSATTTALGAVIANGSGSGQLVYGTMPSAATTEPTVSGNKTKFSIAREFTNNSGADITVREVGLFSGSDMLARLILAQPVFIPNGESEVISVDFETEV